MAEKAALKVAFLPLLNLNRGNFMKRLISMLLLLAMLLSCLPVSVSADDTAITEAEEIVDAAPEEDADTEEPSEEEPLE